MQNSETNTDGHLNVTINEFGSNHKVLIGKLMYKVMNCKKCRATAVMIGNIHKKEIENKKISQQTHNMTGNQLWKRLCPTCKEYARKKLHGLVEKYEKV